MDIKGFDNFDEADWEEGPDETTYDFLENLYNYINGQASAGKRNSRKFLRYAFDMIDKGDLKQEILDEFIKNNNISENIVDEIRNKTRKKVTRNRNNNDSEPYDSSPSCGAGGIRGNDNYRRPHC